MWKVKYELNNISLNKPDEQHGNVRVWKIIVDFLAESLSRLRKIKIRRRNRQFKNWREKNGEKKRRAVEKMHEKNIRRDVNCCKGEDVTGREKRPKKMT